MTDEKLTDGEVTGDKVGTNVFPIQFCTYRYPWFARRITGASSPASMVARQQCTVVLQPSPAMAWLDEHGYSIYNPSEALRRGLGQGRVAVKLGRVHGGTMVQARQCVATFQCRCASVGSMASGVT